MASMAGHPHGGLTHAAAIPTPHYAASPILGSPVAPSTTTATATVAPQGGANTAHPAASSLLVANLGPFCSEQELKDLFQR